MTATNLRKARFAEAYLAMAKEARYRPQAPSDGHGNIQLLPGQLRDPARLAEEARAYARAFVAEENKRSFGIGCSDFRTNRAFVWTIEAARQLAGGEDDTATAFRLLKMAITELERIGVAL